MFSGVCVEKRLLFETVDLDIYVDEVMLLLKEYEWVYDFPLTEIFVCDILNKIPVKWKTALLSLSTEEMNQIPFGLIKENWPKSLQLFVKKAVWLGSLRFPESSNIQLPSFTEAVPLKKQQEVHVLAAQIAEACVTSGCTRVLDVGSGLAYLGQVLHQKYGFTVVGLESDFAKCQAAKVRLNKGGCSYNTYNFPITVTDNMHSMMASIRTILSDVQEPHECKCRDYLPEDHPDNGSWVVVSLHACGNLTTSVLHLFSEGLEFCSLFIVGCCYHKMFDRLSNSVTHFPLSKKFCLRHPHWQPTVFALRLASERTRARWLTQSASDHYEHTKHVAFRGVLQSFLYQVGCKWEKPCRRLCKEHFASFEMYAKQALKKHKDKDGKYQKDINEHYKSLECLFPLVEPLTLLQVLLQPVLEAVIILDRYTYLKEAGFSTCILKIADDCVSPRNLAICSKRAIKK